MSLSEDEDDFLSADEEEYMCQSGAIDAATLVQSEKQSVQAKIEAEEKETRSNKEESCETRPKEAKEVIEEKPITPADDKETARDVKTTTTTEDRRKASAAKVVEDADDDDEEAVAERIRERNLRIARKFSAEIAKNVKASAPIPVKLAPPQVDYNEGDNDIQAISDRVHPVPPPAPPSTPALSSSFNNNNDSSPLVGTMTAIGAAANTISQYGWRIPAVVRGASEPKMAAESSASGSPSKTTQVDPARSALDRLSEKLSKPEKNLFEMVAEDIKKVTLKSTTPTGTEESQQAIPSISDIGSMLGGWGWNSASQLLASASQVTSQVGSQVGSVIDSVVQKTNPPPAGEKESFDKNK